MHLERLKAIVDAGRKCNAQNRAYMGSVASRIVFRGLRTCGKALWVSLSLTQISGTKFSADDLQILYQHVSEEIRSAVDILTMIQRPTSHSKTHYLQRAWTIYAVHVL